MPDDDKNRDDTNHLLSSEKNAKRLEQSLKDYESGIFVSGELSDDED